MYSLDSTSSERWIFISGKDSFSEPDAFVSLVKAYQSQLGGKIFSVSDEMQYSIVSDPLKLVFQWDTLFGITVIVPDDVTISTAETALQMICDLLNDK